jgi:hypothetical protein
MDMILYQCKILHLHPIKFKHFIFYFLFNLYIYEFLAAHSEKIPNSALIVQFLTLHQKCKPFEKSTTMQTLDAFSKRKKILLSLFLSIPSRKFVPPLF